MDLSCKASRDQSPISLKYSVPHFYGIIDFKIMLLIQTRIGAVKQACKIYLFAENGFIDAWYSSSVHTMVSGINFAMNKTVKPHMLENIKNVADKR